MPTRTEAIVLAFAISHLFSTAAFSEESAEVADAGVASENTDEEARADLDADGGVETESPAIPAKTTVEGPQKPAGKGAETRDAASTVDPLLPYAKGDMEPGFGFGFSGAGTSYYMILSASFAYYLVDRFAAGVELDYGTDFGSARIPDDFTILPFAKFVLLRSKKFAPYAIVQAGREFEFAGDNPVHSWLIGLGAGAHIALGTHFLLNIEVTFRHYWYDDPRVRGFDDDRICEDAAGREYPTPEGVTCEQMMGWQTDVAVTPEGAPCVCAEDDIASCVCPVNDRDDLSREWVYPMVGIGAAFVF